MTMEEKEKLVKECIDNRKEIKGIYCIYDRLAKEVCSPLFYVSNDDAAKRSYVQVIGQKEQYPDPNDYSLIRLGYFDKAAAMIVADTNDVLITGLPVGEVKE